MNVAGFSLFYYFSGSAFMVHVSCIFMWQLVRVGLPDFAGDFKVFRELRRAPRLAVLGFDYP